MSRFWMIVLITIISSKLMASDKELKLKDAYFGEKQDLELSGMVKIGDKFYVVSDKGKDHFLYELELLKNKFKIKAAHDFSGYKGYSEYLSSLQKIKKIKKSSRRIDLEGLAACGETIYVANERVRQIFTLTSNQLVHLPIDFTAYARLFDGGDNAGFEGIAVDCDKKILYVAKERGPRQIFKVDLKSLKVISNKDFAGSDRQGQKVINPRNGEGLQLIDADIAGMHFYDGHLYVLERNTFEVSKLNPITLQVVSRVSYWKTARYLYQNEEPYGLAEALYVDDKSVYIGIDNGPYHLTRRVFDEFGASGTGSALLRFKRPKKF